MSYASRQSSYLIGSIGATIQVLAGWWDVYSHLLLGGADPWWNPAHLVLYAGVALVIFAVWRGLRERRNSRAMSPIPFVNTGGLKLARLGCVMQVTAGAWNEIIHHVFIQDPRIAPAHALLTLGMLTICLGMAIGLSIEHGMTGRGLLIAPSWKRWATLACLILIFSSVWLTSAGALIYVARVFRGTSVTWIVAVLMSIAATLVLVPAKLVLPKFGSVTLIGLVFNAVAFYFLVAYLGDIPYFPWGLIPPLLFDALSVGLRDVLRPTAASLISSASMGLLFYVVYFPFSEYLFPWSAGFPVVILLASSILGASLGLRVYYGVTSLVLGDLR